MSKSIHTNEYGTLFVSTEKYTKDDDILDCVQDLNGDFYTIYLTLNEQILAYKELGDD